MLLFGEKSLTFKHSIIKKFVTKSNERLTTKDLVNLDSRHIDLALIRIKDGWHLGDRGWISKKTIYDIISNLNQHIDKQVWLNIYITNEFGTYDTKDLITKLRTYKKFSITGVYIKVGKKYETLI